MMSYSVFYIAEMSTMSTCADQFQISLVSIPSIHAQHTHTHTHACMHTRAHTQSHTPRSLSLLPGCDPETAVCLHASKGEWLSIGMTSTQEIIGTSETPPTTPFYFSWSLLCFYWRAFQAYLSQCEFFIIYLSVRRTAHTK